MAVGAFLRSSSSLVTRYFATSGKRAPLQERKLVDRFRLSVRGGPGGSGCTSFRKSRHSRHGTADGGNGGRGGDVILVSSAAEWDFSNLQHHLNGKKGGQGSSKRRVGSRGLDKIVQVPVGTVVHLVSGSIPSLEPPPVTPDHTTSERSRVSGGTEGISVSANDESSEISAAWLDDLFLDNSKARLLAEKSRSLADSAVGTGQRDEHGVNCDREETASPDTGGVREAPIAEATESPESDELLVINESGVCEVDISGDAHDEEEGEDEDEDKDKDEDDFDEEADELSEVIPRRNNTITRYAVAEFVKPGQSLIMGTGAEGGRGNASYARGVGKNKLLPSLEHEDGLPGSEAILVLELKTIADVGLVGAPNAGKSTLLGAMSRAKPTVGHYAFTTLRPNIGKLEYDDHFALTVADIPGLIKGAHENRGLGHAFLRHIERTKALAYVVDLSAGIGDKKGPLPWDQLDELKFELDKYEAGLSTRPALVVANKIDEPGTEEALEELRRRVGEEMPIFPVCAVLEEGVDDLRAGLRMLVDEKGAPRSRNTAWMRSRPTTT
ncbi:hypothetical protein KC19_7G019100 [Ceratodon purpureus]|uniref:Uncharacterized protein n=1 Tax=Ceratodon purpureus TaxID=3225 RepID=A0A8T0H1V9_CERPU|nr:hypothetical protein KC19_7G019100 [Ceratodon purpureus]